MVQGWLALNTSKHHMSNTCLPQVVTLIYQRPLPNVKSWEGPYHVNDVTLTLTACYGVGVAVADWWAL